MNRANPLAAELYRRLALFIWFVVSMRFAAAHLYCLLLSHCSFFSGLARSIATSLARPMKLMKFSCKVSLDTGLGVAAIWLLLTRIHHSCILLFSHSSLSATHKHRQPSSWLLKTSLMLPANSIGLRAAKQTCLP